MSLRADHKTLQLCLCWHGRQDLAPVLIEVDHVEHDLASLLTVGELREKRELFRHHALEVTDSWGIRLRVLSQVVSTIENTSNSGNGIVSVVKALVLKVNRDPAAINKNCLLLALCTKVSVEGSDDIDTLFTVAHLLNLSFASVIKDAADRDWLHGPSLLKLVNVGTFLRPNEAVLVSGGDIGGLLLEQLSTTCGFPPLFFTSAVLVLS